MTSNKQIIASIPEFKDDFANDTYDAIWRQKDTLLKHWPRELFDRMPSSITAASTPQQNPFAHIVPSKASKVSLDNIREQAMINAVIERNTRELQAQLLGTVTGKMREMILYREVPELYNSVSFANRLRGRPFNVMLTVSLQALAQHGPSNSGPTISAMNKRLERWATSGLPDISFRKPIRCEPEEPFHDYVWVIENGPKLGLHVHQLMWVPETMHRTGNGRKVRRSTLIKHALDAWFSRRIGVAAIPSDAVHVTSLTSKYPEWVIKRQWRAFRYMIKNLSPHACWRTDDGRHVNGRSVLKPFRFHGEPPIPFRQLAGCSHTISVGEQKRFDFSSKLDGRDWDSIYSGWEVDAFNAAKEQEKWSRFALLTERGSPI